MHNRVPTGKMLRRPCLQEMLRTDMNAQRMSKTSGEALALAEEIHVLPKRPFHHQRPGCAGGANGSSCPAATSRRRGVSAQPPRTCPGYLARATARARRRPESVTAELQCAACAAALPGRLPSVNALCSGSAGGRCVARAAQPPGRRSRCSRRRCRELRKKTGVQAVRRIRRAHIEG